MKEFCKKNITSLLIILVFVIYSVFVTSTVWNKTIKPKQENRNIIYDLCYDQKYNKSIYDKEDFFNYMVNEYKFDTDEDSTRFWYNPDYECENIMKSGKKYSAVYLYNSVINSSYMKYFLLIFLPLLIVLATAYDLFKVYKDKDSKKNLKKDYKKETKKLFVKMNKPVVSVLVSLLLLYIICFIFTGKLYSTVGFSEELISSICSLGMFLMYIVTIVLGVGVFVNLTLAISSINDGFGICSVETYLFYMVLWLGVFVPTHNYILSGEYMIDKIYYIYAIQSSGDNSFILLVFMLLFYLITLAAVFVTLYNNKRTIEKCD